MVVTRSGVASPSSAWLSVGEGLDLLQSFLILHHISCDLLSCDEENLTTMQFSLPINFYLASNPAEKESLVTPVIESLSANDDYSSSRALSHALTIRADARLDCFPPIAEGALEDSRRAAAINPLNGRAWRVLADAEEANGDIESAIQATARWGEVDPSFATKAKNEIARLSKKA